MTSPFVTARTRRDRARLQPNQAPEPDMSTQFAPREVAVQPDILSDVLRHLHTVGIPHTTEQVTPEGVARIRVAPDHAADLADAITEVRASKEERGRREREAKASRSWRASIDVGGLSLTEAERLVALVKQAPSDLQRRLREQDASLSKALGIADPEHEATIRVRFERSAQPSRLDVRDWVAEALYTYFNEHERYCGLTGVDEDDEISAHDVIKSVVVVEVTTPDS